MLLNFVNKQIYLLFFADIINCSNNVSKATEKQTEDKFWQNLAKF